MSLLSMSLSNSLLLIFTLLLQVVIGLYGWKILKIADYIDIWRKGWAFFIIAAVTTLLRRVCELVGLGVNNYTHIMLSVVSTVFLLLFIYCIAKVFVNISKLHDESIFTTVLKEIPIGILIHDLDSSVVYSNPMASKILGTTESLSGLFTSKQWHFLREDSTPLPEDEYPVNRIIKSGKAFSNMVIGINHRKSTLWVLCNAYFINEKNQVVTVFADVSYLKRMEGELGLSEEKYRRAFMSSHDGIIISRMSDGLVNSINKTFTILTGYTEEEIKGKTTIDLGIWKNIEDRNKVVSDLQSGNGVMDFDCYFVRKDGKDLHGLVSASTLILNQELYILTSVRIVQERLNNQRIGD